MKKNLRKTQGITMVAIVVTIVVLLILASISMSMILNNKIIGKAKESTTLYNQKEAEETMNFKITNAEMHNYGEKQTMPTLQEMADIFCTDDDFSYVKTETQKTASLDKIVVGDATSIFTKLKAYPYEFEIDNSLKLASINGVKVADTNTVTRDEYNSLVSRLNALEKEYTTSNPADIFETYDATLINNVSLYQRGNNIYISISIKSKYQTWLSIGKLKSQFTPKNSSSTIGSGYSQVNYGILNIGKDCNVSFYQGTLNTSGTAMLFGFYVNFSI